MDNPVIPKQPVILSKPGDNPDCVGPPRCGDWRNKEFTEWDCRICHHSFKQPREPIVG